MGRTAGHGLTVSRRRQRKLFGGRPIDVHTGVGNFLSGVAPNQNIVAVTSAIIAAEVRARFVERVLSGQKLRRVLDRVFFAAPASEACSNRRVTESCCWCLEFQVSSFAHVDAAAGGSIHLVIDWTYLVGPALATATWK